MSYIGTLRNKVKFIQDSVYSLFDLDMIYCNYLFENGSVMQMSHNKYTIHEKYTKSYTTKDMLYFYKYKNIDADVGSSCNVHKYKQQQRHN